ncbi:hypothetical protein HXA35_15585 [Bacillus sp. A301a_S52]|nr:hypothetical protein [Bacillus sp. A301a_S52]
MKKIFLIIVTLFIVVFFFLINQFPNHGGYIGEMRVLELQKQHDKYIIIGQIDNYEEEIRVKSSKGDTIIQDTGFENKEVSVEHVWEHIEENEYYNVILSKNRLPFNISQEYELENILLISTNEN